MLSRSLSFGLLVVSAMGCAVPTDLGKKCTLVRKDTTDPTGKRSIAITEGEIKPNKDFISFGATECEDLVCVRDALAQRPQGALDTDPAIGYCSRPCTVGSPIGCPAADPADDKDPNRRLTCRALLLDEATLNALDPATRKRYFGDTSSPFFCARGAAADGGT